MESIACLAFLRRCRKKSKTDSSPSSHSIGSVIPASRFRSCARLNSSPPARASHISLSETPEACLILIRAMPSKAKFYASIRICGIGFSTIGRKLPPVAQ